MVVYVGGRVVIVIAVIVAVVVVAVVIIDVVVVDDDVQEKRPSTQRTKDEILVVDPSVVVAITSQDHQVINLVEINFDAFVTVVNIACGQCCWCS